MGTPAGRGTRDVASHEFDRTAVGCDLPRDQIEESGLAGAVGTDDQPPLADRDVEIDACGDTQAAECLAQGSDGEGGHGARSGKRGEVRPPRKPAVAEGSNGGG